MKMMTDSSSLIMNNHRDRAQSPDRDTPPAFSVDSFNRSILTLAVESSFTTN